MSNDWWLRRQINILDGALRAVSGDEFALQLLELDPDGIDDVADEMVAKRVRRPVARDALIDQLAGLFPRFAPALRQHR